MTSFLSRDQRCACESHCTKRVVWIHVANLVTKRHNSNYDVSIVPKLFGHILHILIFHNQVVVCFHVFLMQPGCSHSRAVSVSRTRLQTWYVPVSMAACAVPTNNESRVRSASLSLFAAKADLFLRDSRFKSSLVHITQLADIAPCYVHVDWPPGGRRGFAIGCGC